jgi:hypothetical protein
MDLLSLNNKNKSLFIKFFLNNNMVLSHLFTAPKIGPFFLGGGGRGEARTGSRDARFANATTAGACIRVLVDQLQNR